MKPIAERFHEKYVPEPNTGCWSHQQRAARQDMEARGMTQPVISITLPIKTVSEANTGGKLRAKIRRKKEQEHIVALAMSQFDASKVKLPAVVRMTRLSFGELDDDNLRGAMKKIRDGVAAWIGIDDGDVTQVMYQYAQGFAARNTYAVTIEVFGGYRLRETLEVCE